MSSAFFHPQSLFRSPSSSFLLPFPYCPELIRQAEAKRQQILYNNVMNKDAKRRTAEKSVLKGDQRVVSL